KGVNTMLSLVNQAADSATGPDWIAILTVGGFLVGVLSVLLAIWYGRKPPKYEHGHEVLLETVERDYQAKYTQDQIKALTSERKHLEEQVARQVPQEARRVFLQSRQAVLSSSIAELYEQYKAVTKELMTLPNANDLAPEVRKVIEHELLPEYLTQQRRQRTSF